MIGAALIHGPLRAAYEAVRIIDGMVTAGSLDNARAAVLEARTRRQVIEALEAVPVRAGLSA